MSGWISSPESPEIEIRRDASKVGGYRARYTSDHRPRIFTFQTHKGYYILPVEAKRSSTGKTRNLYLHVILCGYGNGERPATGGPWHAAHDNDDVTDNDWRRIHWKTPLQNAEDRVRNTARRKAANDNRPFLERIGAVAA